jgi:hypothetical protein
MPENPSYRWAIVEGGVVVNAIVWDGVADWNRPKDAEIVSLADYPHVGIGWDYTDGEFVDNRPVEEFPV